MTRTRTVALALGAALFAAASFPQSAAAAPHGCTHPVGSSHSPVGAVWAAAFTGRAYVHPSGDLQSDPTNVSDEFPQALADAGLHLDSSGTGSCVVYDTAHRIAASTQGGDTVGSSIGYAPAPPVPDVPNADLSHVRSERGLHLGMSVADLVRTFGAAHHVRTSPDRKRTYYYYRHALARGATSPVAPQAAADALVIFTGGKATYISLVDIAP